MGHNGGRTQLNLVRWTFDVQDGLIDRVKACDFPLYNWGACHPDNLDVNGWPIAAGVQYLFELPKVSERPGIYVVRWQGTATFSVNIYPGTTSGTLSGTNGRFYLHRTNDDCHSATLNIGSLNPADPPHHIECFHEDDEARLDAGELFTERYLQVLRDYNPGVLRFLDLSGAFDMWTHIDHVTPYSYSTWGGYYAPKHLWAGLTTNVGTAYSVALSGFVLEDKAALLVQFNVGVSYPNTATLNVNGTGAKPLLSYRGVGLYDWYNEAPISNGWGVVVYDAILGGYLWKGGSSASQSFPFYTGLPREAIIKLCNEIGAHPWISFSYMAYDSDVVNVMAAQFRDGLDPGLVCRYEYSNETWNYGFEQNRYCLQIGTALWGAGTVIESIAGEASGRASSLMGKRISAVYGGDRTKYQVCVAPLFNTAQTTLADSQYRANQAWHDWFEIADHVADGGDPASMWATHFTINNYWSPRYGAYDRYEKSNYGQELFDFGWAFAAAKDAGDDVAVATLREQMMNGLTPDVNTGVWGMKWYHQNVYKPMVDIATAHGLRVNCYEGGIFMSQPDADGYMGAALTNITQGSQTILTVNDNSIVPRVNDYVFVTSDWPVYLVGMGELLTGNLVVHKVVAVNGQNVTIDLNSSAFTPYVSGGVLRHSGYGEISAATAANESVLTMAGATLMPRRQRIVALRGATGMTALNTDNPFGIYDISGRNMRTTLWMTGQPAYTGGARVYFQGINEWIFALKMECRQYSEAAYDLAQYDLQACIDLGIEFPSNYTFQRGGGLGALPGTYWGEYSPYFRAIADFNAVGEAQSVTTETGDTITTESGDVLFTEGAFAGTAEAGDVLTTEAGDVLTTEAGDVLTTEGEAQAGQSYTVAITELQSSARETITLHNAGATGFPATLPDPLRDSYTIEPQAVTVRTDMEAGAARVRRRFTKQIERITVGWILDETQLASFKTFYDTGIQDGSQWFDMPLDLGAGNVQCECRFIDRYSLRPLGMGRWRVDAQLEKR